MTAEEYNLLREAAADPRGQIVIKRSHQGELPSDRGRLAALMSYGYLAWMGETRGPPTGETLTVWQITPAGRANAALSA
jgi:carboxypeptidase C (cathepsin A)